MKRLCYNPPHYEKTSQDTYKYRRQATAWLPSENANFGRTKGFKPTSRQRPKKIGPVSRFLFTTPRMKIFACMMIRVYQAVSRGLFPPTCRFYPSCSNYAYDAIVKYGLPKGILLTSIRILKCSPLSKGGHDPVK